MGFLSTAATAFVKAAETQLNMDGDPTSKSIFFLALFSLPTQVSCTSLFTDKQTDRHGQLPKTSSNWRELPGLGCRRIAPHRHRCFAPLTWLFHLATTPRRRPHHRAIGTDVAHPDARGAA